MASKMLNSKPVKMWIDGKIFHIQKLNKKAKKLKKKHKEAGSELEKMEFEEPIPLDIKDDDGKFLTNFRLPKVYYEKIQWVPNFSIEKLSEDTQTKIYVPKPGQEGEISVHGDNTNGLVEAVKLIHSAIGEIRQTNMPLQFLCIPCAHKNIRERFEHLKTQILSMKNEIEGIHESIFMSPLKLHLTIDVYTLLDDREKAEAIQALNDYKTSLDRVLEAIGPIKLSIGGLNVMNNNIKKVDVLYANVKMVNETDEHTLQKIVDDISHHFYDRGLAKRYQDSVKLHMTVINTKYRKYSGSPRRKRHRQSIDATKILDKFKDYSFGECDFDSLHLSHISVKGDDGFYKPIAVINLIADSNKDLK